MVQIAVLSMLHARQDLPLGRAIAFELGCENHPRDVRQALKKFPEACLGRVRVTSPLHEDVEDIPVLIHGAPQILTLAIDWQKDLIQVPLITRSRASATSPVGIHLAKLATPIPHGFVRQRDTAVRH